jgi:hypothetical protein
VNQRALPIIALILLSACGPFSPTASSPAAVTPSLQPLPAEIAAASEWIEVDLAAQEVLSTATARSWLSSPPPRA